MPDGLECYWTVLFSRFETILTSRMANGRWTEPELAPFAGRYFDGWPAIRPDGKRMFFHSSRPLGKAASGPSATFNIWYVDRTENGWSDPLAVGPPVNGSENATCPSVTRDGTIYISKGFPTLPKIFAGPGSSTELTKNSRYCLLPSTLPRKITTLTSPPTEATS